MEPNPTPGFRQGQLAVKGKLFHCVLSEGRLSLYTSEADLSKGKGPKQSFDLLADVGRVACDSASSFQLVLKPKQKGNKPVKIGPPEKVTCGCSPSVATGEVSGR